jgi:hypothetical protein
MNSRDKFLSVMKMNGGDYGDVMVPKVELGYWAGTIRRWFDEGLPKTVDISDKIPDGIAIMANKNIYQEMEKTGDENVGHIFGLDQYLTKFPVDYSPMFETKIIEKTDKHVLYKDEYGVLNKNDIDLTSLPMELDHPVKDRKSWNEYKQFYETGSIRKRLPPGWENLVKRLKDRDFPIRLGGTNGGFLGFPRQIMGLNNYLLTLYDDPELIHDICGTFLEFLLEYYAAIIRDVEVDCILIWEDMAGKMGSLISPAHFREFMAPAYRSVVNFAREMGVDTVIVDSDGFMEELIPLISETGVSGMYPFEKAAGNDLLRIRRDHPDFILIGGVDKRVLFADPGNSKRKIDNELEITEKLLKNGRYIPHIDHFVSQDCTWQNFTYYRNRLNSIIDKFS